ncbi:3-oxo-tetronate kinase [Salinarimonas soli]|uniref:3-oxo-tetronate kinase n=1 Tax=Salinarimonas soli TaxID=1638099 RepID=A0A5B2VSB9_9HYPH|nr:3-oxo-tetronate kinase [Salinarimonas soli]KAA2241029.1 four-carbon acid sugar kinase family protein [Salinarimonas soli]
MLLGVIADDFTGASDVANTLARGGLATMLHLGLPRRDADAATEAGVVALKSRSIPADEAVALSLQALDWLKAQGCRQIVFKICSTFDSTPEGNVGPVSEALAGALGAAGVPVCPAFPATGRTVYQGHLFVGDRLLSESGMERHPLNPMTDPDLRRWLARQSREPVGLVPWRVVRSGAAAIRDALQAAAAAGERQAIVDAIVDEDLIALGAACADAPLLTGGSGIAQGLPANFIRSGLASGSASAFRGVAGPEAILAGSCSKATLEQILVHVREHPSLAVDVEAVLEERLAPADLAAFVREHEGQAPLVFSSAPPGQVAALQERHGREAVAHRLDALFADTARLLVEGGVTRLVVAGGETSGAVVSALGLDAVAVGPEIDPGVPALASPDRPLALALKSGNFGAPDFFAKALAVMARDA